MHSGHPGSFVGPQGFFRQRDEDMEAGAGHTVALLPRVVIASKNRGLWGAGVQGEKQLEPHWGEARG